MDKSYHVPEHPSNAQRPSRRDHRTKKPRRNVRLPLLVLLLLVILGTGIGYEARTNELQATFFSRYAQDVTWHLEKGPSRSIAFPTDGPYDLSRGYALLPRLQLRLNERGFVVSAQARQSRKSRLLLEEGIPLPYEKSITAGLRIYDHKGLEVYRAPFPSHQFPSFESIPPLLVDILLYRENRELMEKDRPFLNPAVEWDRFTLACFSYLRERFFGTPSGMGGSTLATQIEKFRHSSQGMTKSPGDKFKQIIGASLWAYRNGPSTLAVRKDIVREYLNGMPLGAAAGHGEINGIGNGMWAWFGKPLEQVVSELLLPETRHDNLLRKAKTLKETLALIIATQRPSLYLGSDRKALEEKVRLTLNSLAAEGIITETLRNAVLATPLNFRPGAPVAPSAPQPDRKGATAIRIMLLDLLGVNSLYELDRLDLSVETSVDFEVQQKVNVLLGSLYDPQFLQAKGFIAPYLLDKGDPQKVIYSIALFESFPEWNSLRIQADTLDQPLDINIGTKLELGSTAKLRTLASYLMAVDEADRTYSTPLRGQHIPGAMPQDAQDALSAWVRDYRRSHLDISREELLRASLQRTFSANPDRVFFTGGGIHRFNNFDKEQDSREFTVEEGFRHSVNLVFIRIMRELVNYHIARLGYDKKAILSSENASEREVLLREAADVEATEILRKYYRTHAGKTHEQSLDRLRRSSRHPLRNFVLLYLKENPKAALPQLLAAARIFSPDSALDEDALASLYRTYRGKTYSLTDEAYLLGKHPLQLWIVGYLKDHPKASWSEVLEASTEARRQAMTWLFNPRFRSAQNQRIRTILERKAFEAIHRTWRTLGYPFPTLVPSLATAIGSSADRPVSLAELVGIILNDGLYKPTLSIKALHFAQGTPYETHFSQKTHPVERVMSPEVAQVLKYALRQVVKAGTGARVRGEFLRSTGDPMDVGGKTGTGNNQFKTFRSTAEVISAKIINRTSTFVFFCDRFFGIVTAHVPGEAAGDYGFTSALAVQTLKTLKPAIEPLIQAEESSAVPGSASLDHS